MLETRVRFALEHFLKAQYFSEPACSYELEELEDTGKSVLTLQVGTTDNLCRTNFDDEKWRPRFSFIKTDKIDGMDKCVDHFILKKSAEHWELHMFEMKTTVGLRTWHDIRHKMRASYLKIRALAVFLGIELSDDNIFAYTTYEKADLSIRNTTNPRAFFPLLGEFALNVEQDEWLAGCINLPMATDESTGRYERFVKIRHQSIKMERTDDNFLTGKFTI